MQSRARNGSLVCNLRMLSPDMPPEIISSWEMFSFALEVFARWNRAIVKLWIRKSRNMRRIDVTTKIFAGLKALITYGAFIRSGMTLFMVLRLLINRLLTVEV